MDASPDQRFPLLAPEDLTPEQRKLLEALLAGPRGAASGAGGGAPGREAMAAMLKRGPFNAFMRSPELGELLQRTGAQLRFSSSLEQRLTEFAILITARHWSSQYEWYAHHPLALKAGLDAGIAAQLAARKRPEGMREDEAAVHDFCTELHEKKRVSDETYRRAAALFGERGVMDLIGLSGYYTLVSMTLNVAQVPVPGEPPLK